MWPTLIELPQCLQSHASFVAHKLAAWSAIVETDVRLVLDSGQNSFQDEAQHTGDLARLMGGLLFKVGVLLLTRLKSDLLLSLEALTLTL